jgi:bifunctional DNase/RNase
MSDNEMLEVKVVHLGLDRSSNTPVVILQEKDGERVLPIWIGPSEASAIAMELAGVKFSRPLTHDLVKQIILGLGGEVTKVSITRVKENTYFAEMEIHQEDTVVRIDARPSDSIAVALRLGSPIFTQEDLLGVTSIDLAETAPGETPDLDSDSLKSYLEKLDPEDFGKFVP